MLKRLLVATSLMLAIIAGGIAVFAISNDSNKDEKSDITITDNANSRVLNKNPEAKFKDNSYLETSQSYDINKKIDSKKIKEKKGTLKLKKLMTYEDYQKLVKKQGQELTAISKNRKVWIVQTEYTQGYEHPKLGLLKNATITALYDAESGEYLGCEISAKK